MTPDELREFLRQKGLRFDESPIQHATQFRLAGGEIFTVYNSGKLVVWGRRSELSEMVEALEPGGTTSAARNPVRPTAGVPPPSVFIVYGHDEPARDALELLLRRMGLDPLILLRLPSAGDTVIEKLERYWASMGMWASLASS